MKNKAEETDKENLKEVTEQKEALNCSAGKRSSGKILLTIIVIIFGACLIWNNISLLTRIMTLEQNISDLEGKLSQHADNNLKIADNNRKIYVFNMDETVKNIGLQEANQKFEEDINNLDAQVKEAQAAIKDIKDEKMKKKMLNLSIKPLEMKRDDLLESYSKSVQETLTQINTALAEIATENNIPVVFMNKSIAVNTNYVVDVTSQVVEKIKAKQQK